MVDGYLDLAKFLTQLLGPMGSLLALICVGLAYMWNRELVAHEKTRSEMQELNEKRIEAALKQAEGMKANAISLEAIAALLKK